MDDTRWWRYVQEVIDGSAAKDAADHVGIDKSNFTRWKQGGRPAVEFVLKFARRYDRPVVEALAAAEYITDTEARIREVKVGVEDLSEIALARELLARVEAHARTGTDELALRRQRVRGSRHDDAGSVRPKTEEEYRLVSNDSIDESYDVPDSEFDGA